MKPEDIVRGLENGETALGIELGSTRIKSVLIGENHRILGSGSFQWENRLKNGVWTYSLEDAVAGVQQSYALLAEEIRNQYGIKLKKIGVIGVSAMMHGYLPLDKNGRQLAPFLTWRNTNTVKASEKLTALFGVNIPLRWSIAQLYQAMLNGEGHVAQIDYITTLAGYIHLQLSGQRVLGIGDASGMFPIDSEIKDYDSHMLQHFRKLVKSYGYGWDIREIMPEIRTAGEDAGVLTEKGAALLDPSGSLSAGIPMAPPEGDAGTGMTATNAVEVGTGNVSAGTSIFSMVVLEKPLSREYRDIDMVTTPTGHPVAMVHCNNGTSELDTWVGVFQELAQSAGLKMSDKEMYQLLFKESLKGDLDCNGILFYNFQSGEPVVGLTQGRPMITRHAESSLTLSNFMRSQIYSVMASLAIGMRILKEEQVPIRRLTGHGGMFKTSGIAQRYMSAALEVPITVMHTAGEGGPYGMAVLAMYKKNHGKKETLESYLQNHVFSDTDSMTIMATSEECRGYASYLQKYEAALPVEASAVEYVRQITKDDINK